MFAQGDEMTYPGGKGLVYQRLINLIPPHRTYIETHLGGGAIMLNKRLARFNYGIDIDRDVIYRWYKWQLAGTPGECRSVCCDDGAKHIKKLDPGPDTFAYCDPPYLMETRKSGPLYRYEYTKRQHVQLLKLLLSLNCMVMISGYRHPIYDDALLNWRRIDYQAMTRQSLAWESAWMNYPAPKELHDYQYLGADFRERERIQRKEKRWINKLKAMPVLEQQALLAAMNNAINP